MFRASVLADSLNAAAFEHDRYNHHRLTTMELRYPRCIHPEFLTHAAFTRNSASSRAIPIEKMLLQIEQYPFIPIEWGRNQSGMQAGAQVEDSKTCEFLWLQGRDQALDIARRLHRQGLHKQIVNRVVEPWMWITVIATGNADAWENFFHLRCSGMAEPHIREVAFMARDAYDDSTPRVLTLDEDHTPLIFEDDTRISRDVKRKVSTGRCARVSYMTHHGERDLIADVELHDKLENNGHWSPFGHVGIPSPVRSPVDFDRGLSGNLGPWWIQYRKLFPNECCTKANRDPKPS